MICCKELKNGSLHLFQLLIQVGNEVVDLHHVTSNHTTQSYACLLQRAIPCHATTLD